MSTSPAGGGLAPALAPKKLHHIGIPVRSLEKSLRWYRDVLGIIDPGIAGSGGGPEISQAIQVDGVFLNFAFMVCGDVKIELLEFETPRSADFTSRNCDVGVIHVCFEVDDIEATYRALTAIGVEFNAPPIRLGEENGPLARHAFAYFRDPDGIQFELFEVPDGGV
jgi:catechol 2,3-dioxygenase-like lactoylglutathione lyase family enzyme